MTAPTACKDCNTRPRAQRIATNVPGTQPVTLSLCDCDCDFATCKVCKTSIRNPWAKVCACGTRI